LGVFPSAITAISELIQIIKAVSAVSFEISATARIQAGLIDDQKDSESGNPVLSRLL
jgi:hypothetical protein